MRDFLLLRLEAPLQAWGDVAMDPRRPTRAFPSRSALAGMIASALGWEHRDGARTTALQDALRYAVREDVRPSVLRDYHTADLDRIGQRGWTRWGIEARGGAAKEGTQIQEKFYLADASLLVALTVDDSSPVALDEVEAALRTPARPLFLGRRGCPPATPLVEGRTSAESAYTAVRDAPRSPRTDPPPHRCWYAPEDGPAPDHAARVSEIWDRRDFVTQRFGGSRRIVEGEIGAAGAA